MVPSGLRIRSTPAMWMRTPPAGFRPRSLGTYCREPVTSSAGMIFSRTARCSP